MKKMLALVLLSLIGMFSGGVSAQETNLKFSIGEWQPYTGEKIANHGLATEIVTDACKAIGIQSEYIFAPWKRAENDVLNATYFGTFPYKEIAERKDFIFSDTLFSTSFGILMSKKNKNTEGFTYSKPEDLRNFKVGIIAGTDAIKIALKKVGITVEEVPSAEQNLKKLEVGRIDFYIDDKAVMYQAIQNNYPAAGQSADFVFSEKPFGEPNDWKIMVSKKYPEGVEILKKINEGLVKIKESGELAKLMGKYGL